MRGHGRQVLERLDRLLAALGVPRAQGGSEDLLEQILAPSLRSRNPERRKEAVEALENLAATASYLKHLLLVRDLRKIAK